MVGPAATFRDQARQGRTTDTVMGAPIDRAPSGGRRAEDLWGLGRHAHATTEGPARVVAGRTQGIPPSTRSTAPVV